MDPLASLDNSNILGQALNGLAARQRVISNNLANIDTPGFKASEVKFERQLQNVLAGGAKPGDVRMVSSHPTHISLAGENVESLGPIVAQAPLANARADGNNVDVESEMVQLAETNLSYSALVQIVAARVALARYLVNEGRR